MNMNLNGKEIFSLLNLEGGPTFHQNQSFLDSGQTPEGHFRSSLIIRVDQTWSRFNFYVSGENYFGNFSYANEPLAMLEILITSLVIT